MINKASQLLYVGFTTGQKVEVPLVSLSCSGAKDTTQSLWETVGLLKKHCYQNPVDAQDVLKCSMAATKCGTSPNCQSGL